MFIDIFTNTDIELQMGGRLQCYTCQSLNGDLSEPCWSLGNKTNNFEEFEDKFGENSPNKVTVETCKPTQRSCKVNNFRPYIDFIFILLYAYICIDIVWCSQ